MTDQDAKGRFAPGNKLGRGAKRRAPKSLLKQAVTDSDVKALLQAGLRKAKNGSDDWAMWFLDRHVPRVKAISPPIHVELDTTDMHSTLRTVLERTAAGEISTDQAKDLLTAAQAVATVVKLEELQNQLEEIKQQMEAGRARLKAV